MPSRWIRANRAWFVAVCLTLLISDCAGPNSVVGTPNARRIAGFWSGLWHGMICPIAFMISLFNHNVSMYEVHNSGNWYNFGFILGAGAWGILRGGRSSSPRHARV